MMTKSKKKLPISNCPSPCVKCPNCPSKCLPLAYRQGRLNANCGWLGTAKPPPIFPLNPREGALTRV